MNKNIIVSSAAAAALAAVLTGCGSDSATSTGSSVSGVAAKAPLRGATVTIAGKTASTAANGAYVVSGITETASLIEVTGGVIDNPDGTTTANTVTLKAEISDDNAGNIVSVATTMIKELKDANSGLTTAEAKVAAMKIMGITDETELFVNPNTLSNEKKNRQALLWSTLKTVNSSSAALAATMQNLKTAADGIAAGAVFPITAGGSDAGGFGKLLQDALQAGAAADSSVATAVTAAKTSIAALATTENMAKQEEMLIKAADNGDTTVTEVSFSNTINLEGNTTSTDANGSNIAALLYQDGVAANTTATSWTGLKYTDADNSDDLDVSFTNFNANNSIVSFKLVDFNGTYSGETDFDARLVFAMTKQEDNGTNANTSYQLALDNIAVSYASDKSLSFATNSNTSLLIGANSNTSKAYSISNANISNLLSNETLYTASTGYLNVNVAKFANYVKDTFGTEYDDTTYGNFSSEVSNGNVSGFATGNYSLGLYVKIGDKVLTSRTAYDKAGLVKTSVGGTEKDGYKVIDTKLVIQ